MTRSTTLLVLLVLFTACSRKNFFQPDAAYYPAGPATAVPSAGTDSLLVTAGRHYQRSNLHQLFFGKHYRSIWAAAVKAPVFRAQQVKGGLSPVELGGGFQTTSLTLKTGSGQLYTLRTLDKDPVKTLPDFLQKTFLLTFVRDQTSAGNPYAPFILPPLAQSAGIYHTTPQLYYVAANDVSLGKYSEKFRGKVVMLEEKFSGKANLLPAFGGALTLTDSEELLHNRYESPAYTPDQQAFARARLFDLLIGDWDRHEGQWQWAVYKNKDNYTYRYHPIPKDRDQAFCRFDDGLIPWLVSRKFAMRKFRTFKPRFDDIKGLTWNARFIDERLLNEVTREGWAHLATELRLALPDDVLETALRRFPDTVYQLEGPRLLAALKQRRDHLHEAADTFYDLLAKKVTIAGTDQKEKFVVNRLNDGETLVTVFALAEEDQAPYQIYKRTFNRRETRLITLHGLAGNDVFTLDGSVARGIRIKIIGGPGKDKITDRSKVQGWGKKTLVYDTKSGTELELGSEAKNKTTRHVAVHAYDREGY